MVKYYKPFLLIPATSKAITIKPHIAAEHTMIVVKLNLLFLSKGEQIRCIKDTYSSLQL